MRALCDTPHEDGVLIDPTLQCIDEEIMESVLSLGRDHKKGVGPSLPKRVLRKAGVPVPSTTQPGASRPPTSTLSTEAITSSTIGPDFH